MRYIILIKYMSIEQATYELVKENNMLLKAIYQKLLENENNDFSQNVVANIVANMLDGSYQRQRGKSI